MFFHDAEPFEQIDNLPSTEGPKCNLMKVIGQTVSEKKTFKDYEILYMYIAQGKWPITLEDKILFVTKRVCYFDHTLYVSASSLYYGFRK